MYTKLTLVFTTKLVEKGIDKATKLSVGIKPESFEGKSLAELKLFDASYGRYRKDEGRWPDRREYVLLDQQVDFNSIFDLIAPFENDMDIQLYFERIYDDEDYKNAEACVLRFPKKASFYDEDGECGDRSVQANHCEACRFQAFESGEEIWIRPDNGVRTTLCNKMGGVTTPHSDPIVSQLLKDKLIEEGIDECYFKPVFTKKGKLLGYQLYGGDHVLPLDSVKNRSLLLRAKCPLCGRVLLKYSGRYGKTRSNLRQRFSRVYAGDYPMPDETVIINRQGMDALCDVNWTSEFFWGERYVIVSKSFLILLQRMCRV